MSYGRQQYGSYGRHGAGNYQPRRSWEATNEEDKKETAEYQNDQKPQAKQWPAHQARIINSKYQDIEDDNKPDEAAEEKEACAYNYKPPSRHRQYYGGSSSSSSSSSSAHTEYYKPAGYTGGANKSDEQGRKQYTAGSSSVEPRTTGAPKGSSKYTLTEEQMYPRSRPIQPYINNAEDDDDEEETGEDLVNQLLTLSPRGQHVIPRKPGDPRFGNTKIVVEDLHLFMDNNEIEDFQWNRKY